jgi:Fur family transcriptional regulator, ferric uptake regulator
MEASQILHEHQLKRTSCREGIIETIMHAGMALSENEIREKLVGNYDRTTFYRSFKTLHDNKIIHKIVVDNQIVKYALDNAVTQKHSHAHFYCHECDTVQCMDSIPVTIPQLPAGFTSSETEMIIKGCCSKCKTTAE